MSPDILLGLVIGTVLLFAALPGVLALREARRRRQERPAA